DENRKVYQTIMEKAAVGASEAWTNRRPVRIGSGSGRAERACFNRRYIMSDGKSRMHGRLSEGVTRIQAEGPVDDELLVTWFEDYETGEPLAILVNLASHPNQMYGYP